MEEHSEARQIVETLTQAGFIAYYAGGWVRDFLLNHPSDDIDIATNAPPEVIQTLFPRTVPIGIAFGIVLVIINHRQYEVATFRQDIDYQDGRRPTQIAFTTAEEDAKRRDFTINGMFYDPLKEQILDYVEGQEDLKKRLIRAIGNPHERIREDRLRMMRALRLSCRFQFEIEPQTAAAIRAHAKELFPAVAVERIVQELEKARAFGNLRSMLLLLNEYGLLQTIFPALPPDVEEHLLPTRLYPEKAPFISYLLALFPNASLQEQKDLVQSLKCSNHDQQFALFLYHARHFVTKHHTLSEWAYFYANAFAPPSLQILSAHLPENNRLPFLQEHEKRIFTLHRSLERIHRHDPVVKSQDLIQHNIKPGPTMGRLLKEADRISIDEQIHDAEAIISRLKSLPLWPKS
jgi:poly(A) polymerase